MASYAVQLLNTLCEPCYSWKLAGKSDTCFRTNIDIFEGFFFFLQHTTKFLTFSLPLTKKKKQFRGHVQSEWANLRAITDQIFSGLHARKELSLESEKLFGNKKKR